MFRDAAHPTTTFLLPSGGRDEFLAYAVSHQRFESTETLGTCVSLFGTTEWTNTAAVPLSLVLLLNAILDGVVPCVRANFHPC
jgi:hypothetical protein